MCKWNHKDNLCVADTKGLLAIDPVNQTVFPCPLLCYSSVTVTYHEPRQNINVHTFTHTRAHLSLHIKRTEML